MIPAAIEVVGGVGIAEQAGEPDAEIPRVDRDDDVAFVVDDVLQGGEWIASLTEHRVVDQALLAPQAAAVEGHTDVVAGRRLAIRGLALHEQMRARTIGSRHASLLSSVRRNCSVGGRCCWRTLRLWRPRCSREQPCTSRSSSTLRVCCAPRLTQWNNGGPAMSERPSCRRHWRWAGPCRPLRPGLTAAGR